MDRSCLCAKTLDIHPQQVHRWMYENKYSDPVRVDLFRILASRPSCVWLGDWTPNPRSTAKDIADHAKANSALFQIVLYNIPNRDAGGFSAGGSGSREEYLAWLREVASGLANAEGIIIVEPDALAHSHGFDAPRKESRLSLLRDTAVLLKKKCKNALVYLDSGHPDWLTVPTATELLLKAGIRHVDGISLNVANAQPTEDCYRYGMQILSVISSTHGILIDTSRNGAGPPPPSITGHARWANNPNLRLGGCCG